MPTEKESRNLPNSLIWNGLMLVPKLTPHESWGERLDGKTFSKKKKKKNLSIEAKLTLNDQIQNKILSIVPEDPFSLERPSIVQVHALNI